MKVPVDVQAELMGVSATATAAMSIATPAAAGGPRTTRVAQSSTRVVAMTATTTTVVGTAAGDLHYLLPGLLRLVSPGALLRWQLFSW